MHGAFVVGADNDAIGFHEVFNRGALLQKFRIRYDAERHRDAALGEFGADRRLHRARRTHRHRALVYNELVVRHVAANAARGGEHVLHVGGAVFVRRRAHGDELDRAKAHALLDVAGEVKALRLDVAQHDFFQARLEDGNFATQQHVNLGLIEIDAQHIVAHFGKTRAGDETYIAGAYNCQFHGYSLGGCASLLNRACSKGFRTYEPSNACRSIRQISTRISTGTRMAE